MGGLHRWLSAGSTPPAEELCAISIKPLGVMSWLAPAATIMLQVEFAGQGGRPLSARGASVCQGEESVGADPGGAGASASRKPALMSGTLR
jgi:hypothetical protein